MIRRAMGLRKQKRKEKLDREAVEESERFELGAAEKRPSKSDVSAPSASDDDDDREANEDLTLGIIEKSKLLRAAGLISDGFEEGDGVVSIESKVAENGVGLSARSTIKKKKLSKKSPIADHNAYATEEENGAVSVGPKVAENGVGLSSARTVIKKKKLSKRREIADQNASVTEEEKDILEEAKVVEVAPEAAESSPVEARSNNIVLRKLLRGPRYFDPPDSSWGTCYNCGEEGHSAAQCTSARRKKPCFVCGSFEHNVKQCTKGRDCFICKKGGHRAKDCPDKYKSSSSNLTICLKCGDSGHEMFSCKNDYHPDDLKEITCYVCKKPGHLCCVSYAEFCAKEDSCYRCGQLGHTGPSCMKVIGEGTTTESCFRCGEGGHFARECPTTNTKKKKRNRELSTPNAKPHREAKGSKGAKSAPHDLGKPHKKKKKIPQHEESGLSTPRKPKQRGGWITEDPADYPISTRSHASGWRSPATPSSSNHRPSYATPPNVHYSSSRYDHQAHHVHQSHSRYGNHNYHSNSHYDHHSHHVNTHHDARYGYQTPVPRYPPRDYYHENGHSGSRYRNHNSGGGGSSGWNRGNYDRYY